MGCSFFATYTNSSISETSSCAQMSHLPRGRKCFPEQYRILLKSRRPGLCGTQPSLPGLPYRLSLKAHTCASADRLLLPGPGPPPRGVNQRGKFWRVTGSHPRRLQVFPHGTRTLFPICDFKNAIDSPTWSTSISLRGCCPTSQTAWEGGAKEDKAMNFANHHRQGLLTTYFHHVEY